MNSSDMCQWAASWQTKATRSWTDKRSLARSATVSYIHRAVHEDFGPLILHKGLEIDKLEFLKPLNGKKSEPENQ